MVVACSHLGRTMLMTEKQMPCMTPLTLEWMVDENKEESKNLEKKLRNSVKRDPKSNNNSPISR